MWPFRRSHRPLVSAIVIFKDNARFLAEAIESVLAQTYRPIEVLLVDDGSTDGSGEIARSYADRHGNVTYHQHEGGVNRGISATRNLGMSRARGEFVAFLDGDDVWLPKKLRRQVRVLRRKPELAVVATNFWFWFSWAENEEELGALMRAVPRHKGRVVDRVGRVARGRLHGLVEPPELLRLFLGGEHGLPSIITVMVRRDRALEVGGFVEEIPVAFEDVAFLSKLALEDRFHIVPEPLARYRQHGGSISHEPFQGTDEQLIRRRLAQIRLRYMDWLVAWMGAHGGGDEALGTALEKKRRDVLAGLEMSGERP